MVLTVIAFVIAGFFAMNIGASGTAAAMGPAYGSGAIKTKRKAMMIVAVCAFLGALGGGAVVRTIGGGIIPSEIINVEVTVIILASACLTLFIANLLGIPLSTSEVLVGSLVGAGIAFQAIYLDRLFVIISFWIIVPIIAFLFAILAGKLIVFLEKRFPALKGKGKWYKWLVLLLVISGGLEAYAAGMNNVANAVGPLVGAGLIEINKAVIIGGLFVSLGAVVLGGKVLETNGKKITRLSLLQGSAVSITGGALVIVASIFGLPVPLTQVTTSAIMGIGTVNNGMQVMRKDIIKKIAMVWVVSPVFSLVICYGLITLFLKADFYTSFVIVSVFIATGGSIKLVQAERREKRAIQDQGSGI